MPGIHVIMRSQKPIISMIWIVMFLALSGVVCAADSLWVSQGGKDSYPGTEDKPFATVNHGLSQLKPGMTLHVLPGNRPWPGNIRITVNGTADKPITVDGHGSLISGRGELPADAWTAEGNNIFSRPMPNNAWGMGTHWEGGFPLVWFAGKAGRNVTSCEELTPGGYFLHKNRKEQRTDPLHNTLYICLNPEQTPEKITSITGEGGIYVGGDHVIVRNFITEFGGRDGFATHRNQGVVFEHIEARHFMDQGMSHHGAEVTIRKAHFHHNAGAGVVDVYPECKTRYENCLIELDTWRGGVEFHSGEYEMVNCIIRANPKQALTVAKGAKATLRNCLLIGITGGSGDGITVGYGSQLTMHDCTVVGFQTGLSGSFDPTTRVELNGCEFLRCGTNVRLNLRADYGGKLPQLNQLFRTTGLATDGGTFETHLRMETADGRWASTSRRFKAADTAGLASHFGGEILFRSGRRNVGKRHGNDWPFDRLDEFLK